MAQIDLGKLKFTWQGNWVSYASYEVDDVVIRNGSSYICIADALPNATHGTAAPEANNTNWDRMTNGLNFRGQFQVLGNNYYLNDVVFYQNNAYILQNTDSVTGITPNTTAGDPYWIVLASGTGGTYTTAGDIEYRLSLIHI